LRAFEKIEGAHCHHARLRVFVIIWRLYQCETGEGEILQHPSDRSNVAEIIRAADDETDIALAATYSQCRQFVLPGVGPDCGTGIEVSLAFVSQRILLR
jgi:hypothetical protein